MVAEQALGVTLAVSRHIVQDHVHFRTGEEVFQQRGNTDSFTLYDKLVGFIGFGGLALNLKPLLAPFRCKIQVYDPWLPTHYLCRQGVTPVDLDTLLETSKVIYVLAIPSASTRAMLDCERLARIQPDSVLVLISRAQIVDFDALTDILTLPSVAGVLLCCSLGSYALAKINFVGRNVIFYLFLAGIIIPFQAIMVPLYYQLRDLGLLTTYWAGILPMIALGIPFGIFLLRAFLLSLPSELIDAAKIDGCDDLRVFWFVMLPLAKPALFTLGIVQFIGSWNAFLLPLLYLQKQNLRPLTLGLLYFQTRYESDYTLIAAGITIIIIPMILVYFLFQRQFVEGLTSGALKG